MFGETSAQLIVHRSAAVGAHRIDFGHLLTETRPRGRLHDLAEPGIERGDHRAVEGINRIEAHRAIEQCAHLEGTGQAANTRAVDFARRLNIGRDMDQLLRETSIFRRAAPRRRAEMRDLLTIRQFRDLPEALLAKSALESAGIECFLGDDNLIRMDWLWSNLLGGIKLRVRQEDAIVASRLLEGEGDGEHESSEK